MENTTLYILYNTGRHRMTDEMTPNTMLMATTDETLLLDYILDWYGDEYGCPEPENLRLVEEMGIDAVLDQQTDSLYIERVPLDQRLD